MTEYGDAEMFNWVRLTIRKSSATVMISYLPTKPIIRSGSPVGVLYKVMFLVIEKRKEKRNRNYLFKCNRVNVSVWYILAI